MKRNIYILLLIIISQTLLAQKNTVIKANKLFAERAYVEAAQLYQKLGSKQEILQNLGDCYYFNNEMSFAETPYANLIFKYKDSVKPEYYFKYANVLNALNDTKRADKMMSKYKGYLVDTQKFKEHLNSIIPYNYTIKKLSKNASGDFGISIFEDKVVYASLRNSTNPVYRWNQKPYLDLYQATLSNNGELENIKSLSKTINTKTHESSAVFSKDKKTMYFNRTNNQRVKVGNELYGSVKIYRAQLENNEWTNISETSFSSDQFSTQHPALSLDEKRLYFSSDRPGSYGSFDLYYVQINDDGTYGEAVNLGKNVNTKEREQFPFVDEDNTLYFASARNTAKKTYGYNDEPYLDLYYATRNADGTYSKPMEVNGVNTKFHDGPATLSADGNTMYFSSETFKDGQFDKDKSKKLKYGKVGLFKATKEGDKWTNIKALPFNNKAYNVGNPSLSKDGKTLYFSSDMPGGIGGSDIWKVAINGDNDYGTPENLGNKINTEGRENFPFITDENKLYFSSEGRQGFGGLDVFVVDLNAGTEVKNVGMPVNSEKDDFAFSFNTVNKVGFFSSNRGGQDDIYAAIPVCGLQINATAKNAKTGELLSGASVAILDEKNNLIETKIIGCNEKNVF